MIIKDLLYSAVLAVGVLLTLVPETAHANETAIMFKTDGEKISVKKAADYLKKYDVIVFGEYHDYTAGHQLEHELYKELNLKKKNIALSLEMFEADVQGVLDDYLNEIIDEEEFLASSRPWKNYQEDYSPMVEYAKKHGLPVIASNVPRYLAAQYAKEGNLENISLDKLTYLPREHSTPIGEYRNRFIEYIMSGQSGMPFSLTRAENYYKAQCLKDDKMAESISNYLTNHPGSKVFHVQGDFHSRSRLGVVEKLQALRPNLKIAVVTSIYANGNSNWSKLAQEHNRDGDIIVFGGKPD